MILSTFGGPEKEAIIVVEFGPNVSTIMLVWTDVSPVVVVGEEVPTLAGEETEL